MTQTAADKKPTKDLRPLSERWTSLKKRLKTGAINKKGRMLIHGVTIEYLMSDDLMELVREELGSEGIDVRCGMDPNFPITIRLVKTQKGNQEENLCWFRIVSSCSVEGGKDEDVEYMAAQDRDIDIACTYAFKSYLIKRLQISGGNADGVRWSDVEPIQQHGAAAGEHPEKLPALQVSEQEARKASVGPKAETPPKKGNTKKADGAAPGPAKEDFTPEHFKNPATGEEIKGAWGALNQVYPEGTKAKLIELIGRPIDALTQMTVGDTMKVWEHINGQTGSEAPY